VWRWYSPPCACLIIKDPFYNAGMYDSLYSLHFLTSYLCYDENLYRLDADQEHRQRRHHLVMRMPCGLDMTRNIIFSLKHIAIF
jgi:hypothetical protein